jgi:hypothetical protein
VPGLESAPALVENVEIPPLPDHGVHEIARFWYESLKTSAQSQFYEPSDWAQALYLVAALTRALNTQPFTANSFTATWNAMNDLLTTEGARRRARLEVERVTGEESPGVTAISEYRAMLQAKK